MSGGLPAFLVRDGTENLLIIKGSVDEVCRKCSHIEYRGERHPIDAHGRDSVHAIVDEMLEDGMKVLAVAYKLLNQETISQDDENGLTLLGYLAFFDAPKQSAAAAIEKLHRLHVDVRVLTGDNDKVTRTICKQVGLRVRNMLLGSDLEHMSDAELARAAETTDVFAKLTPDQKARVVSVLRENGHTVGFMGDGINDAAAMKAADIGISVDTAVDVAKESADIILLEKDLMVLEQGIIEGRKTYANMIKYIKMTASSNFGNMFSVLAASALLPFLPMMSVHLIFLNLIYDLSCTAIPWDNVDEEFIAKPRKWDACQCGQFHDLDRAYQFYFRLYNLSVHVFCVLSDLCLGRCAVQRSARSFQRSRTDCDAGKVHRNVPGRLVCGVHVEPDPGYPHDPDPQAALYPEQSFRTADTAHYDGDHNPDDHSVHTLWSHAWVYSPACRLLCLSDSVHSALYGTGYQPEKSLCTALWRAALRIGGVLYELDSDLDEPASAPHPFSVSQYGFLGRYGLCSADCDSDECGVLEHKATKSGSDVITAALNPI